MPETSAVTVALAAPVRFTVAPLPPVIVPEMLQVGWTIVTVLPVVLVVSAVLSRAAAEPLLSCTDEDVCSVDGEIVRATVATTPFETVAELTPHSTHVELPELLLHEICLPAVVAAAPAVTVADVKSAVE